jgi:hypothetical protein
MSAHWKTRLSVGVIAVLAVAVIILAQWQPARAYRDAPAGGCPHYTVVATEGHNLIVTDNHNDMLYFYTIDKDKEIGSDLKLRGKVDLKQVGKEVVSPMDVHKQP